MSRAASLLVGIALALGCAPGDELPPYVWRLPEGFEPPPVPADNPMSQAKVELGRRLFYERRLSVSGERACATCHRQEFAFTDGHATPLGADGHRGPRSAMSLVNVAYAENLTWANPTLDTLEEQALVPLFVDEPLELGAQFVIDEVVETLRDDDDYAELFVASFPNEAAPVSVAGITRALAAFERTIIAAGSPYDRYRLGDDDALGANALRGLALFEDARIGCSACHSGPLLDGARGRFDNIGLYNIGSSGAYPSPNAGLFEFTHDPADQGRYAVPTLRNVALTAPYMHDGSIADLRGVIDHFAAGGRTEATTAHDAPGRDNPNKSALVSGFSLTSQEREDLVAFLEALTDPGVAMERRWSDPF